MYFNVAAHTDQRNDLPRWLQREVEFSVFAGDFNNGLKKMIC